MDWAYSDIVKDHFEKPRNILENEETYEEDGKGYVGNAKCGDMMMLVIQVDPDTETLTDVKWKTFGCASAVASTSMLSEMAIGMSLADAYRIKPKDIMRNLGGLPDNKIHCSVLGDKALREAIDDYFSRNDLPGLTPEQKAVTVCECLQVTDADIRQAVKNGVRSFPELQEKTKIATGCGECKEEAKVLLNELLEEAESSANTPQG